MTSLLHTWFSFDENLCPEHAVADKSVKTNESNNKTQGIAFKSYKRQKTSKISTLEATRNKNHFQLFVRQRTILFFNRRFAKSHFYLLLSLHLPFLSHGLSPQTSFQKLLTWKRVTLSIQTVANFDNLILTATASISKQKNLGSIAYFPNFLDARPLQKHLTVLWLFQQTAGYRSEVENSRQRFAVIVKVMAYLLWTAGS